MIQLNTEEIKQILPHRPPMLLVDRIIDLVPFESGVGIKNVTLNEPFFPGHFPGNPIMPGVFILEAMAQVGGMENVKFKRQVIPGDQLVMKAHIVNIVKKNFGKLHAESYVEDKLAATADFIFALKRQ